MNKYSKRDAIN
nr:first leader peptide [Lysinibacillus sphaericus]